MSCTDRTSTVVRVEVRQRPRRKSIRSCGGRTTSLCSDNWRSPEVHSVPLNSSFLLFFFPELVVLLPVRNKEFRPAGRWTGAVNYMKRVRCAHEKAGQSVAEFAERLDETS
mmetsp:Transcript_4027/g.12108  ORF Transcript_4027/g.12108 Transcript_4027/m.12108 type:complete len:111 (-) Transcript_4027:445-777(-)